MPITLPDLDDRRFDDLVEEARALIPAFAPEWTDHNAADPGITLIELFAFLTEMLIYRLNRVTTENTLGFVKLIRGPAWSPDPNKTPAEEAREAVLELRRMERAVTAADYERLAQEAAPERIARVRCVPRADLDKARGAENIDNQPADVSVVIMPRVSVETSRPRPDAALVQTVRNHLEPRRLLTTRLHVVGPAYLAVAVSITVVRRADTFDEAARDEVVAALRRFLHPLQGGADGRGWPFGRAVYVSEIYDLLDRLPSVDFVKKTLKGNAEVDELTAVDDPSRLQRNAVGELVAVVLRPHELVDLRIDAKSIVVLAEQ